MDSALVTSISSIGFSVVACVFLWKAILKKDEENKKYTSLLVTSLEKDIKELKNERGISSVFHSFIINSRFNNRVAFLQSSVAISASAPLAALFCIR